MDFFISINKKEDNEPINGFIYRSIFTSKEIIIIKLNIKYYIQNKIEYEQIKENIKKKFNIKKENDSYKNLNCYIQIGTIIISYDDLDKLLLKEFMNYKNILIEHEENVPKNINYNNKILEISKESITINYNQFDNKINNEQIKKNKELIEKINELEKKLEKEKNKNKILEEKILKLENEKKDINNKYNDIKIKFEIENKNRNELKNDSKESLQLILEKDKEIKELKTELSRFPFKLKEGEKLISIIFTSIDQKIHYPLICKNTDKFNTIENELYEVYPEYSETENFFTFNGNKIIKSKNLEYNKIKNGSIIILNIYE